MRVLNSTEVKNVSGGLFGLLSCFTSYRSSYSYSSACAPKSYTPVCAPAPKPVSYCGTPVADKGRLA